MKVLVKEGCISCGLCTEEFPHLFEMDDQGLARAITSSVPPEYEAQVKEAAASCPVGVIVPTNG